MVEKQCILTEHKEGSGGLAAPADSLTLACHKGESGIGGVSRVGLPATKWEEMALPAQQCSRLASPSFLCGTIPQRICPLYTALEVVLRER